MELSAYMYIINGFLRGELSAEDFQTIYMAAFSKEYKGMDPALFAILQDLFEDADAYYVLCTEENETVFRITEPTLRREVLDAVEKLKAYQQEQHL